MKEVICHGESQPKAFRTLEDLGACLGLWGGLCSGLDVIKKQENSVTQHPNFH